jgi:hypothetical protein
LLQANAISGCGGAPVFAARTIPLPLKGQNSKVLQSWVQGSIWLLGVWQPSWKVKGSEIISVKTDMQDRPGGEEAPLEMGVVIPAIKLLEVLNHTNFVQARKTKSGSAKTGA